MYRWESQITGELIENLSGVIKTILEDLKCYKILNWKWKYNRKGF